MDWLLVRNGLLVCMCVCEYRLLVLAIFSALSLICFFPPDLYSKSMSDELPKIIATPTLLLESPGS